MAEKIVIGAVKGLSQRVQQFAIDNNAFASLINAYQSRNRVRRKRGTGSLTRLTRYFDSTNSSYSSNSTFNLVNDEGNLLTGFNTNPTDEYSLESGAIVPGSVSITVGGNTYTDPSSDGVLVEGGGGTGSIYYESGLIIIDGGGAGAVSASFLYYPELPVMGLRDVVLEQNAFARLLAFDTTYAYRVQNTEPYNSYDISFYKNPATAQYTNYTAKSTPTPVRWNGEDYQNFYTVNYEGAFWATNGISIPFVSTNVGMQFNSINTVTVNSPTNVTLDITAHGLSQGDFLFINEVSGTTGINFQTGYVTSADPQAANTVDVTFPDANIATNGTGGIAQYLTNNSDATVDCLRWYDGDPTDGNATSPTLDGVNGWVNFCPPLSEANFSIAQLPLDQYYLVTARTIVPFKDRLLVFGPVVQTSQGAPIYLQDTVIYSQNGTPYYTASFDGDVDLATTVFNPILVPRNTSTQDLQVAAPNAWFEDQTGYGGFLSAGIDEKINSTKRNEDVIIVGFDETQARLVYTSNDILPFNFYFIDSELGTSSTFSAINLGSSILSRGDRGFVQTTQQLAQRFDSEDIPDLVYQVDPQNNGTERVIAIRDYINEWIFFTYPSNQNNVKFPTRTLFFNYIDKSFGEFEESYTAYGGFRRRTGRTWATIGLDYETWSVWSVPWNAGISTLLQPEVIAGTATGYIVTRGSETGEAKSLAIKNISFPTTITGATQANPCVLTVSGDYIAVEGEQVTITGVSGMTELNGNTYDVLDGTSTTITIDVDSSLFGAYTMGGTATPTRRIYAPDHCFEGEKSLPQYIIISDVLGGVASEVNNNVFLVTDVTQNGFNIDPDIDSGTYIGSGEITRCYVPFIQSKAFPTAWSMARKTRLGVQKYLMTRTATGEVTIYIYKSQDSTNPWNEGPVLPNNNVTNDSLIYSSKLYTAQESTNLGLTAANVNLQQIGNAGSRNIWHRINTPVIGDTVQFAITLNDEQMRDENRYLQFAEIEFHAAIIEVSPSQELS